MEIKRDFYLNKLIKRKHNGLIKVITGIRRCGKSYLLNTLFYQHLLSSGVPADHIIKFAFDSADDLALIGENLIKLQKENKKVDPEKFMAYIRSAMVRGCCIKPFVAIAAFLCPSRHIVAIEETKVSICAELSG